MKLIVITLALTVGVGYLLGGRLANLSGLRIRLAPLALIGFAMQIINPPGDWPLFMLWARSCCCGSSRWSTAASPGSR